jgi:hypothetical protein
MRAHQRIPTLSCWLQRHYRPRENGCVSEAHGGERRQTSGRRTPASTTNHQSVHWLFNTIEKHRAAVLGHLLTIGEDVAWRGRTLSVKAGKGRMGVARSLAVQADTRRFVRAGKASRFSLPRRRSPIFINKTAGETVLVQLNFGAEPDRRSSRIFSSTGERQVCMSTFRDCSR